MDKCLYVEVLIEQAAISCCVNESDEVDMDKKPQSEIIMGESPTSVEITGTPQDIDSINTFGKASPKVDARTVKVHFE